MSLNLLVARPMVCKLFFVILFALSGCASSTELQFETRHEGNESLIDESKPVELPASALDSAGVALKAFKAHTNNWRCFDVFVYNEDGNWRIAFVPSDIVQDLGETLLVGASECGDGVSYVVNQSGKIVRVIYSR